MLFEFIDSLYGLLDLLPCSHWHQLDGSLESILALDPISTQRLKLSDQLSSKSGMQGSNCWHVA